MGIDLDAPPCIFMYLMSAHISYELKVEEVHLLDWYGGMSIVSGKDYYAALDTTA